MYLISFILSSLIVFYCLILPIVFHLLILFSYAIVSYAIVLHLIAPHLIVWYVVLSYSLVITRISATDQLTLSEKYVFASFVLYWSYTGLSWGVYVWDKEALLDNEVAA